ncbi:hypothetical protein C8R43DRAFT_910378 [Mycena crocata]|nr:hypothetical protein C8R43DRAFT_910378 [Mycena crocata]
MADSLPSLYSLRQEYDSCFNVWFESYLDPSASITEAQRTTHHQQKADEFKEKCGKVYADNQNCIQGVVKEKGIEPLLKQAREEHPLREDLPLNMPPSSKDTA